MSDPDERAREIEAQMTDDERFSLLVSVMGAGDLWPVRDERIPADTPMSAGYVPGIPRLGVPPLRMSDAGLGVTNPATVRATRPPRCPPGWRWPRVSIRRWPGPPAK
ncbi:putative beta-glucosidase domain protein [Mycobacterium intracellulare]|nr:putative beta-glucosidase domain protein [Mycobacterium intracellulare]